MKTENTLIRSAVRPLLATAVLLAIPLLAKLFTDGMQWGPGDFVFMGALVFGTGLTYELATRKGGSVAYRVAVGGALAAAFLLVWVSLAVGIIGSEDNAANAMYLAVLAVAVVGSVAARFRPRGMARVLFAMALTQAAITVVAVAFRLGAPASGALELLALNGFFVTLYVGAALLFRGAARGRNALHTT